MFAKGLLQKLVQLIDAKTVVLTTGTYMRGKVIIGDLAYESGPNNMQPSVNLSHHLEELGFEMVRFKTGTPPRVNNKYN